MPTLVRDLMSKQPITLPGTAPIIEAARRMRSSDVGAVIVEDRGKASGIVTDRDIAVRAVAEGRDPSTTPLAEICSKDLTTVSPDDHIDSAVRLMREKAIRRVLVLDSQQKPAGILSLGDLAVARDSSSVLGEISAAAANH